MVNSNYEWEKLERRLIKRGASDADIEASKRDFLSDLDRINSESQTHKLEAIRKLLIEMQQELTQSKISGVKIDSRRPIPYQMDYEQRNYFEKKIMINYALQGIQVILLGLILYKIF